MLFVDMVASTFFTGLNVVLFYHTNFANLIFYDLAILFLMWLSISFMVNFMWFMHSSEQKIHLPSPIVLPHPTFVCALVLTICVSSGYCYIFIYKMALFGCDKAVEAHENRQMALDSILRLTIAVYALVSFIYIIQRAHIGNLEDNFDRITRNIINFVFGVIWFRFLLLKALFIIEQFCRDQPGSDSLIKNFCPPYIKNGFTCDITVLPNEQRIWYRLHYGLLKSALVTCASELIPVLFIAHWIACGRAQKIAQQNLRHRVMNKNRVVKKIQKMFSIRFEAGNQNVAVVAHLSCASSHNNSPTGRALKCLSIALCVLSIGLWLLCFHNYIKDNEDSLAVFAQDGIEVFTALIQLGFFITLFGFTRTIPKEELDPARSAESRADHVLLLGSTVILTTECVCEVIEIIYFSPEKRMRFIVKFLDIFYSVFSELSNWFEVFCLKKIGAMNDQLVKQHRHTLPFFAVCGLVLNCSIFVMTYFYIETEKHNLQEVIKSLPSNYIVLVGIVGRILNTANYVYTFTSALCWLDVLLRYKNSNRFVLGKAFDESYENIDRCHVERTQF